MFSVVSATIYTPFVGSGDGGDFSPGKKKRQKEFAELSYNVHMYSYTYTT